MKTGGRAEYVSGPSLVGPIDGLVAAARAEGRLTVMALPRDWCGYGEIIDGFKAKFGLEIDEFAPHVSSTQEIDAIRAARERPDPNAPDVIEVGLSHARLAKEEGLLDPHKISRWAAIPDALKDPNGYWHGDYYGTVAFEVNADIVETVPMDWSDLAKPEYQGMVALAGGTSSNQTIMSILAAGLSMNDGIAEGAAEEGLRFFSTLNRVGNFVSVVGTPDTLADGRTPILIRWDFLASSDRDRLVDRVRIEVVRPRTGVVSCFYSRAISAFAPHPHAARLWMEYLSSSEAQLARLKAHGRPARLGAPALNARSGTGFAQFKAPADDLAPHFPSIEEQERARKTITSGWDSIVGVKIQCTSEDAPSNVPMSEIYTGPLPLG